MLMGNPRGMIQRNRLRPVACNEERFGFCNTPPIVRRRVSASLAFHVFQSLERLVNTVVASSISPSMADLEAA